MDTKQFNDFQQVIQWVVDEARRKEAEDLAAADDVLLPPTDLVHNQNYWGYGKVTDTRIPIKPNSVFGKSVEEVQMVCPTACCVAGHVVVRHGDQMVAGVQITRDSVSADYCVDEDGRVHSIPDRAQDLLGISSSESSTLFDGDNDADDVVDKAMDIADAYGYELTVI